MGCGDQNHPSDILKDLLRLPQKPRAFISYHHDNDQAWYDRFSRLFSDIYDLVTDSSLDRLIDSDDPDYVMRRIREKYITGTSITIVLCGSETWKRKYVDWEIYATLDKQHALLGIVLPGVTSDYNGRHLVPDRLATSVDAGYANWIYWDEDPNVISTAIDAAKLKSGNTALINNSQEMMKRNFS